MASSNRLVLIAAAIVRASYETMNFLLDLASIPVRALFQYAFFHGQQAPEEELIPNPYGWAED